MNALRNFQILHQNPDLRPLCGHIDTKNCTMLCAVLTPLKKQKSLAFHYIVTKRPSLYSDKHGGVKVKNQQQKVAYMYLYCVNNDNIYDNIMIHVLPQCS